MTYVAHGVLILVLFLGGCATHTPNDSVFNPKHPYQTPELSLSTYKSPELRSQNQNRQVSVAIAISGGGHRAGNFGIAVMKELESVDCDGSSFDVLNEVDYFSTVSGGGFAAGVYISTLFDHINRYGNKNEYSLDELLDPEKHDTKTILRRGYHSVLKAALIKIKSLGNIDRGDFLEAEFDNKLLGSERRGSSLTFGDIFIPNKATVDPTVPMWITNATIYENGSIFPFHPAAFEQYKVTEYTHNLEPVPVGSDIYGIPLALGLKASASFPGAVPATTLVSSYDEPDNKFIHLFDGGLSDNLGVITAMQMLAKSEANRNILIIVDAYNGTPEPFSNQERSPTILEILRRTTGISLDAWRIRHKQLIEKLSSSDAFNEKVDIIYLSFDMLPPELKETMYDIDTELEISKPQQEAIFVAAKTVVDEKKENIVATIFGKSSCEQAI